MDPAILLIIVFIVAPLIERLLKAGKNAQQQPPQQRPLPPQSPRPLPRQQQQQPREQSSETPVAVGRREQESAADMLPDDLWEILTGQKRMPESPPRTPEPEEAYSAEADVEWEEVDAEEIVDEPPPPARWRSAELDLPTPSDFSRPVPAREAPVVVSMEKLQFDPAKRHARFHEMLESTAVSRPGDGRRAKVYRFTGAEDVRRAIVLREILGPPKGLE